MGAPKVTMQNKSWRIKVRFAGNRFPKIYITPDIRSSDPGWGTEVFNRPIERLDFFLPTGHVISMEGMEQYNFFVEAVENLGGGGARLNAAYFCGKLPGQDVVEMWRVAEGKVMRSRVKYGEEWGGTPCRGWKPGVVGGRVLSHVMRG